jgi:hypothetical protein
VTAKRFHLNLSDVDEVAFNRVANRAGVSITEWMLNTLRTAALAPPPPKPIEERLIDLETAVLGLCSRLDTVQGYDDD